jgi:hypothetical protein
MALNEAVFQHQGIDFGGNFDPFHRSGCCDHLHCSGVKIPRVLKVTIEATSQAFGLSDVNDAPMAVFKLITPRAVGN